MDRELLGLAPKLAPLFLSYLEAEFSCAKECPWVFFKVDVMAHSHALALPLNLNVALTQGQLFGAPAKFKSDEWGYSREINPAKEFTIHVKSEKDFEESV